MERENNASKKKDSKSKFLSSKRNIYSNIQPRVVLQRLGKDYATAATAGTSSDNQPSTSGYLNRNQKPSGGGSSASRKSSENNLNMGNNDRVIPSTSGSDPVTNGRDNGVIEFKVAELTEADPESGSGDESNCDCSYYSSPEELVIIGESNSENEEYDDEKDESEGNEYESNVPVTNVREKYKKILVTRSESKVQKAKKFLNLLVLTYSKPYGDCTTADIRASTSGPGRTRRRTIRVPRRPQCNSLKDCIVRVRLPVCGEKYKKKFHVKLSQLICLMKSKSHPLHRFCNALTTRSINYLKNDEIVSVARVLCEFVCAQPVYF